MAVVSAPRVNLNQYDQFRINDLYGLNFLNTPYDQWAVVEASPAKFALNVFYINNDGGYYIGLVTFWADAGGFTYDQDSPFPTGVVASVARGVEADRLLPRIEDLHFRLEGAASLGLSVEDILRDPLRLFAGDDVITGGDNTAFCDEISAGDGYDIVTGARTDGWYDMGRGGGRLDGGTGHDIGLFDMSDQGQAVTYDHDDHLAHILVGGQATVEVMNIEQVEIIGSRRYDRLTGGAADDVLDLYLGGGAADGGEGADRLRMSFADLATDVEYIHADALARAWSGGRVVAEARNMEQVFIEGGGGNDHLVGGWAWDELSGGAGDDHLAGDDNNDVLAGGDGDDLLDGGAGHDYFHLSRPGRVDLRTTGAQDTGEGLDTLVGIEGVYGSGGDDRIIGDANANSLYGDRRSGPAGDAGDDYVNGGGGDDFLVGGRGLNRLYGGSGDDRIYGLGERTVLTGRNTAEGENHIFGGAGADLIFGANGDDVIDGGDDNDQIYGWGGFNTLRGGLGDDAIFGEHDADTIFGDDGNDGLNGHGGDDTISGGVGDDGMAGDGGDDVLDGGAGNDTLLGGWGDDRLIDSEGDELIRGDDGFDIVDYSGASSGVEVRLYTTWDPIAGFHERQDTGGAGHDILEGIEGVVGTAFDDHLIGRNDAWSASEGRTYAEYFEGGGGDDLIDAGSGDDLLLGGAGDDRFLAGDGADHVSGGDGDDIMVGGKGNDRLLGGGGTDRVELSGSASNYVLLRDGDDFILKGLEGRDHLTDVEFVRFSDGTVWDLARQYGTGPTPEVMPAYPGPDGGKGDEVEPLVFPGDVGSGAPQPHRLALPQGWLTLSADRDDPFVPAARPHGGGGWDEGWLA